MTLSDLAAIGNLVNGVAVLISLVFLYFQLRQLSAQVRQAEVAQQALVKQARTNRVMEINARMADSSFAELNQRITRNAADLTVVEIMRYAAHARTVFQNGEDSYAQYRRGLLTESDFKSFSSAMRWGFQSPPLRVAWRRHRAMFEEPFVTFVDTLVSEAQVVAPRKDDLRQWRAEFAREMGPPDGKSARPLAPRGAGKPA